MIIVCNFVTYGIWVEECRLPIYKRVPSSVPLEQQQCALVCSCFSTYFLYFLATYLVTVQNGAVLLFILKCTCTRT